MSWVQNAIQIAAGAVEAGRAIVELVKLGRNPAQELSRMRSSDPVLQRAREERDWLLALKRQAEQPTEEQNPYDY